VFFENNPVEAGAFKKNYAKQGKLKKIEKKSSENE